MISAVKVELHFGTSSLRNGMFLNRTVPTYKDLLKILPTPNDTNNANITGRNKLTFSVVSNMMTAREKDSRVYPASIAAAPMIA